MQAESPAGGASTAPQSFDDLKRFRERTAVTSTCGSAAEPDPSRQQPSKDEHRDFDRRIREGMRECFARHPSAAIAEMQVGFRSDGGVTWVAFRGHAGAFAACASEVLASHCIEPFARPELRDLLQLDLDPGQKRLHRANIDALWERMKVPRSEPTPVASNCVASPGAQARPDPNSLELSRFMFDAQDRMTACIAQHPEAMVEEVGIVLEPTGGVSSIAFRGHAGSFAACAATVLADACVSPFEPPARTERISIYSMLTGEARGPHRRKVMMRRRE